MNQFMKPQMKNMIKIFLILNYIMQLIELILLLQVGQYLTANRCNGVLESDVIFYLLNAHIQPRKIWLCMHGETDYDKQGILGGDPSLNEDGVQFSKELHEFINGRSEVRIGMN